MVRGRGDWSGKLMERGEVIGQVRVWKGEW